MAISFVLDEQLRGLLWRAILTHNANDPIGIDAVRVGDPQDLPLGSSDPDILIWAEREGRILVSQDWNTMIGFFVRHLQAGRRSPGLLLLRPGTSIPAIVNELALIGHAGDPAFYADAYYFIP